MADRNRAWTFWVKVGDAFALGGLGYDSILIGLGLLFYAWPRLSFVAAICPLRCDGNTVVECNSSTRPAICIGRFAQANDFASKWHQIDARFELELDCK